MYEREARVLEVSQCMRSREFLDPQAFAGLGRGCKRVREIGPNIMDAPAGHKDGLPPVPAYNRKRVNDQLQHELQRIRST